MLQRIGLSPAALIGVALALGMIFEAGAVRAQVVTPTPQLAPLPSAGQDAPIPTLLPSPDPPPAPAADLSGIVKDEAWARILGKALFWDTIVAANGANCGGCHFTAGANLKIPDQSDPAVTLQRASAIIDVCSRQITLTPAEISDSGPIRALPVSSSNDADPACNEDISARLARTLLQHRPLGARTIDPNDSTFGKAGPRGNLVSSTGRGLERTYQWMIQQAFEEPLWSAPTVDTVARRSTELTSGDDYRKVERNFPLFWGVSIMLYESSLDPEWARFHGCGAAGQCREQLSGSAAAPGRREISN